MGIYDRDYYRNPAPRGGFGTFSTWSVTTWLIIINIVVFVADGALRRYLLENIDIEDVGMVIHPPASVPAAESASFVRAARPSGIAPWAMYMGPLERWGYFSEDTALRHLQLWRFITFQFLHASPGHLIGNMLALFFFGPV